MYVNELIPKPDAEKAVNNYAFLYTKVEGSKQYIRNRYNEARKALASFKKAKKQAILWSIPTIILLLITFSSFPSPQNSFAGGGVLFAGITIFVIFKWSGRKILAYFKARKLKKFADECEKEFAELSKALGGKQTAIWSNEFQNELESLVGNYMLLKYDDVNKSIMAYNKKYAEYRDFVNLSREWSKAPVIAEFFRRGLVSSIQDGLREYERKKDAEEIKGIQRDTLRALDRVSAEMETLSNEIAVNTAATIANTGALETNTKAVEELTDTLKRHY